MTDPAPAPQKPPGPMKYILLGCGILAGVLLLGMGGCGAIFYFIYKGTEPVAEVGAEYLRKSTKVQDALGKPVIVKRHKFGFNVHVVNDGGNARITYDVNGAEAVVWLLRSGGTWSAVGARIQRDGTDITVGKPPSESRKIQQWDD